MTHRIARIVHPAVVAAVCFAAACTSTGADSGVKPLSASMAQPAEESLTRDVQSAVEFLASPELEGRGPGTRGLDIASGYLAARFKAAGLQPVPGLNGYFQNFDYSKSAVAGSDNRLAFGNVSVAREDFNPLALGAEGEFNADVVFVGYGITSSKYNVSALSGSVQFGTGTITVDKWNDYDGIDVKGKVVFVMRFEPVNEKGASRFSGTPTLTDEADLEKKVAAAQAAGAAAVVLVTPPEPAGTDRLTPVGRTGEKTATIPVVHIRQKAADVFLKAAGHSLADLQKSITTAGKPQSKSLGVKAVGRVQIKREVVQVRNVVAMLPGKGPLASEYIVIGAHYDHLGMGGRGSLSPGQSALHPGADDNASGTSAMLELAEIYGAAGPQARTMIFMGFTVEEMGLLGSARFVDKPPIDLTKIALMLNLDMVGRVRNDIIQVGGVGTAEPLAKIVESADAASPLGVRLIGRGGLGPSDHASFGRKKVPVLFLFSGMHPEYHRPADVPKTINFRGIAQSVLFARSILDQAIAMPMSPYIDKYDSSSWQGGDPSTRPGRRVRLGVTPDYEVDGNIQGVKVSAVGDGSVAAEAGLKAGDIIVGIGETRIDTLEGMTEALGTLRPGASVNIKVLREGKTVVLTAKFPPAT